MYILIIILVVVFIVKRRPFDKPVDRTGDASGNNDDSTATDYSNSYRRKYLFSQNEKNEFKKLVAWAQANNYYVFPKVRLLDIIEPRSNRDKSLLWKIQAKHVDFLICDSAMRIKYIIELDDNSHDRKDRSERDEFVRQALCGAGYTVLHTRGISDQFLEGLGSDENKGGVCM